MNYFEALAQQQMVAATKAIHKAAEKRAAAKLIKSERDAPMKPSAMEQDQLDKNTQLKLWRAHHRAQIEEVINGPHHDDWRILVRVAQMMTLDNPSAMIEYVQQATWLHDANIQTRQVVLAMIAKEIIKLRETAGYPPFDDSLPGEEPTAFEIIRSELKVLT